VGQTNGYCIAPTKKLVELEALDAEISGDLLAADSFHHIQEHEPDIFVLREGLGPAEIPDF
jgi:hypothetical protein